MATWLSASSLESERLNISVLQSEGSMTPVSTDEELKNNFEPLDTINEQCRKCSYCLFSRTLITDSIPHHSKDMK